MVDVPPSLPTSERGEEVTTAVVRPAPALHEGWHAARSVLHGPLRRLVTGQAIGEGADGLAQIAFASVVLFDIGKGATPARIAGILAATLLPFSLVGPFAGVVIDRWDRRRVLVLVSIARAIVAAGAIAVVILQSEALAYVGILLLLSSSRFVLAAKGAALPRTVPVEQLVTANAVSSVAGMVAAFGGGVIGATFVGPAPAAGFGIAAALYAIAALVFVRLPPVGGGDTGIAIVAGFRRARAELVDGVKVISRDREIRDPLLAVWLHRLLLGAGFVLLVLIADRRYHFQTSGYAIALAVTGVAAFAGTVVAPMLARAHRPRALLASAFAAAAIAALLAGYWPNLPVLIGALGVTAFAFQVLKTLVDALVGGAASDVVRGRVFAAYDVLYNVAFVVAGIALVPLWKLGRERALLWWIAVAFVAAGLAVASWMRAWPFALSRQAYSRTRPPGAWRVRLAACVVGAVPVLAFPAPSWWWLAWLALVPLLLLVGSAPTIREAGMRAWWGGGGFMLAMHHWLVPNIGPFILLAAGGLGVLWFPWGCLVWTLLGRHRARSSLVALVLVPAGWVCIEAARSWASLGGPWGLLGASQWNFRPTLASAALGGVFLVSFLIVTVNVAIVIVIEATTAARARLASIAVACVGVAVGPLWFAAQPTAGAVRSLRIAVVQPGVVSAPAGSHIDVGEAQSEALTRSLAGSHVDLVIWGESSFGYDLSARPELLARLETLTRDVGADLMINVDTGGTATGAIHKTAVLITPSGIAGTYDKMRLVPFGEYIPFRFALGWLDRFTEAAKQNRLRGHHLTVFHDRGVTIGPLICFESAFPDMSRHLASMGADLIVVQSSTSTFQDSWAPAQHASLAAVRAVETGRPVVHAALTGPSSVFDAHGRRLGILTTTQHGVLVVTVPLAHATTLFDRVGFWVPALSFTALLGSAIVYSVRRARAEHQLGDPLRRQKAGEQLEAGTHQVP
jgi:apolipoprotein N-acyltransferase